MVDPQSLRQALKGAAPSITLFVAVFLMAAPLNLVQGLLPTPLLPLIVIYLYAVYDADSLPPAVVFVAGLLHDLLEGGGVGVWASVYLGLQYLVYSQHEYLDGRAPRVVWMAFVVGLFLISIVFYVLSSLLTGGLLPPRPLAVQLLVTIGAYPFASMLFFFLRRRVKKAEDQMV